MDRDAAAHVHGYSRVEIDDFVASVAEERARLERAITDDSPASLDPQFWPADPERKRRFSRPRVRTMAAPTLAGLLVVAALVLRVS